MEWLMLHEIVMASMLPKPQQPTPADPPLFSISTPIWATLVLRPNRRCNVTTTQTSAVRYTAGIEKKTHLGGEFRRRKCDYSARRREARSNQASAASLSCISR